MRPDLQLPHGLGHVGRALVGKIVAVDLGELLCFFALFFSKGLGFMGFGALDFYLFSEGLGFIGFRV